jgi:hypothetical protein
VRLNLLAAKNEIIPAPVFSLGGYVALLPSDSAAVHGNAHVGPNTEHSHPKVKVPCTTLDDFARERRAGCYQDLRRGSRVQVLEEAERLFTHSRPRLICEVHDPANAS